MKDQAKISAMREGGRILGQIRDELLSVVKPGVRVEELEKLAQTLISQHSGASAAFQTVPGYKWATCIMKNEEVCHGIPQGKTVNSGDIITIDVGLIYKGYYTDTTGSVFVGKPSPEIAKFLETGKKALVAAIDQARVGNSIWDVSHAMQSVVEKAGYHMVFQLTGHTIGKHLHEEPYIPCVAQRRDKTIMLEEGQTIAIEPMYAMGNPLLVCEPDGWTYRTQDRSLSAMFEHTVLVTSGEPEILTKSSMIY